MASGLASPTATVVGLVAIVPVPSFPQHLRMSLTIGVKCRKNMSVAPLAVLQRR